MKLTALESKQLDEALRGYGVDPDGPWLTKRLVQAMQRRAAQGDGVTVVNQRKGIHS